MFLFVFIALLPLAAQSSKLFLEKEDFENIQRAVDLVEYENAHVVEHPVLRACYADIGCFLTSGPMGHTGKLPDTPTKIGTRYYAYSQSSPSVAREVDPYDLNSLDAIAADKPLGIIIHGWRNDGAHPTMLELKDSLLKFGGEATVISVDWEKGAADTFYTQSAVNTELVGRQIAFLTETLKKYKSVDPKNVHLVGFSLGAQVAGFAGKFSQTEYSWKYGRITGLDAAAPLFESYPRAHLTKADATFVDSIHTSAGTNILSGEVGMVKAIGEVDFYPNNGRKQPRCKNASILDFSCDHWSAVLYFESSLSGNAQCSAYKCDNWNDFVGSKCHTNSDSRMGYWSRHHDNTRDGTHYSHVNEKYPYCQN